MGMSMRVEGGRAGWGKEEGQGGGGGGEGEGRDEETAQDEMKIRSGSKFQKRKCWGKCVSPKPALTNSTEELRREGTETGDSEMGGGVHIDGSTSAPTSTEFANSFGRRVCVCVLAPTSELHPCPVLVNIQRRNRSAPTQADRPEFLRTVQSPRLQIQIQS